MAREFIIQNSWLIWLAVVWVLPWKGYALWKAAKNNQPVWFIFLLVVNTLAILEILYIFVFAKDKWGWWRKSANQEKIAELEKPTEVLKFEDFKKADLRVGKILRAEKIENSEKLLKLQVDLGNEKRQIVAGIGKYYSPDDLIGGEVIVVANLEPRSLMGFESRGMLLAASDKEVVLLKPSREVVPGSKVQ
ncbi:MAG: methionine--tRNA ligase subunit beta [Patescibacteria group bacterium]|nr:methionine--tRNA ligase subunit beta [Patescibacteria group bacterium]